MGERQVFQPLTREDKISVVLYRTGIVLSAVIIVLMASFLKTPAGSGGLVADILLYALYASVGMSVFFIHLYVGSFKVFLKRLYYLGLLALAALLFAGNGSASAAIASHPYALLLLLPLSGCLGFITAKEAFCFRLLEGYLLAITMPLYMLLISAGILTPPGVFGGLVLIAALLLLFTVRKVFMPLAYDIGDKSAYR